MSKALVILGMHRSGTSLLASWLAASGLALGDELLGEGVGNDRGHFEDLDFLRLHERILRDNGIRCGGLRQTAPLHIAPERHAAMATLVAQKNAAHAQWGWKEPRTCLFVKEYEALLPAASYLIVYRHYAQVVDSLIRRDLKKRQRKLDKQNFLRRMFHRFGTRHLDPFSIKQQADNYLATWITYTAALVELAERRGRNAVRVLDCNALPAAGPTLGATLAAWDFTLKLAPVAELFDAAMIHAEPSRPYHFNPALQDQADRLLARLHTLAQPH